MLRQKLMGSAGGAAAYIEDVFSTYLYTGNGSTQTINNGIDLAGKGGLVWIKGRNTAFNHLLYDTQRGISFSAAPYLSSNTTSAETVGLTNIIESSSSGFNFGTSATGGGINGSGNDYASWTFRKQPKFFDVVTYTGNGAAFRNIAHNLGAVPGCIICKRTDSTGAWGVWHRYDGTGLTGISLNATSAANYTEINTNTSTTFCPSQVYNAGSQGGDDSNINGATYVAYLFAHNAGGFGLTGTDNVISCGSFTNSSSNQSFSVNLGYEPQYVLIKNVSDGGNWIVMDVMRGQPVGGSSSISYLWANSSSSELSGTNQIAWPTATGFSGTYSTASSLSTYIYIAIRRGPMKVPTDGTKVFSPNQVNAVGGTKVTTNFPVDLQIARFNQSTITDPPKWADRLRGVSTTDTEFAIQLQSSGTGAESSAPSLARYWDNTGFKTASYYADAQDIYWNFRRAPGFFDEVCYTGTGSAMTVNHNLGVAPELMIVKSRSAATDWYVKPPTGNNNSYLRLNATAADAPGSGAALWNSTAPTSTVFTVGTAGGVNTSGATYVAYLFASCLGVSKVGSYTGTGATQTINCGFTGGARFVLIKRTDSTGDWYVWDSARGIASGNDPYLLLNSTAAEVTTTDYISPQSSGFGLTASAPAALNASGGTYIFLAIA